MKLTVVLAVLIGILVLACSSVTPVPAEPTPNIDATVEAKVAQERAVDATVEAKVSGTLSAPEAKATSSTQAACQLTGGETVQSGWTGEDTGDNSCNSCFCTNGALGCTKMACPAHVGSSSTKPVPTPKPTLVPTPSPTATPVISDAGSYALVAEVTDETVVTFHVNGRMANERAVTHKDGVTHLDLTVSSDSKQVNHNPFVSAYTETVFPKVNIGKPFLFIGTVYIDGQPAPDGTSVSACGHTGTLCGYTTVSRSIQKIPTNLELAPENVFADLIANNNLYGVWALRGGAQPWQFYFPDSAYWAFNSLLEVRVREHMHIYVHETQDFDLIERSIYLDYPLKTLDGGSWNHAWLPEGSVDMPTLVPTPTSVPTPTPRPLPTATLVPPPTATQTPILVPTPTPVPTPYPTATPVPIPPTEFKGGFVLKIGYWSDFYWNKNITFKIDDMSTDKTLVFETGGRTLVDLYANSDDSSGVAIDTSIRTNQNSPPWVLAGRAYIDGQVAPDGTWVTAWSDGVQIPGAAVQVNNNPTPKVPPGLEELLSRTRAQQIPAPTPCPWCEEPYQGPLKDAPVIILNAWKEGRQPIGESETVGENTRWGFYSSLPEWRLANDLPKSESSCYGEWILFGGNTMINPLDFGFSEGESREHKTTTQLWPGWNGGPLCVP